MAFLDVLCCVQERVDSYLNVYHRQKEKKQLKEKKKTEKKEKKGPWVVCRLSPCWEVCDSWYGWTLFRMQCGCLEFFMYCHRERMALQLDNPKRVQSWGPCRLCPLAHGISHFTKTLRLPVFARCGKTFENFHQALGTLWVGLRAKRLRTFSRKASEPINQTDFLWPLCSCWTLLPSSYS